MWSHDSALPLKAAARRTAISALTAALPHVLSRLHCVCAVCGGSSMRNHLLGSVLGFWPLDTSKSKYTPGPPHRSATITVTDAGKGNLTFVTDITDGTGEKDHTEFTCAMDRTECPVAGGGKRTVSITKLNNRNLKLHWKFNDPPPFFVDMLIIMSKDGQTQVATSTGQLPDGTALAVTEVWHKA